MFAGVDGWVRGSAVACSWVLVAWEVHDGVGGVDGGDGVGRVSRGDTATIGRAGW